MRALFAMVAMLMAACSQPSSETPSPAPPTLPSAGLARICSLPVWWDDGTDIHAAFVSVPDGRVTDAGTLPPLPQAGGAQLGGAYGATFNMATRTWLRVGRPMLAPDGKRYAYWTANPSLDEIHVVDVATGADRVVYSGPILFIVLSFESDAIYVVHAINPKQGAFELLFRLEPAGGGTPTLVPGSDRHMYQFGWVLISDGAAWGIDVLVQGNVYTYSILRLDLATARVTQWLLGPQDDLVWPLGTDAAHRLYVQGVRQHELWRLAAPVRADQLPNPGPIRLGDSVGGPGGFVSDSQGVWFGGRGSVWLYSNAGVPKQFVVGLPGSDTWPAGPCLLLPP